MNSRINFSGCTFEAGQTKMGLQLSTNRARSYFPKLAEMGIEIADSSDIQESIYQNKYKFFSTEDLKGPDMSHYEHAFKKTTALLNTNLPLLNWGGDHSIALSTVSAFLNHYNEGFVVWIDAHADLNIPSKSLTGNFHGMPLSFLLNLDGIAQSFPWMKKFLKFDKLIYIGLRDIDPFEKAIIKKHNIKCYTWEDIQFSGINSVAEELKQTIKNCDLHISFDIDSVDPLYAPSTGVPVKGGIHPQQLKTLSESAFASANLRSLDIVEINPCLGNQNQVNRTYEVAFNFLKDLLHFQILGDNHDKLGKRNQTNGQTEVERCL